MLFVLIYLVMAIHIRILNWALIFILKLRFPPGKSLVNILTDINLILSCLTYSLLPALERSIRMFTAFLLTSIVVILLLWDFIRTTYQCRSFTRACLGLCPGEILLTNLAHIRQSIEYSHYKD